MVYSLLFKSRFSVLFSFIFTFLIGSFLIRSGLLAASLIKINFSLLTICRIFMQGFIYDLGVALFMVIIYAIYLLLLPQRLNKSWFNQAVTYAGLFITLLIAIFSFFAELTFWQEFESRFNFIAVDYLIYTTEVINNIKESYPLPYLIGGILSLTSVVVFIFVRKNRLKNSFQSNTPFKIRLLISAFLIALAVFYGLFISNSWADTGRNRYANELSKAGVYSIFAAFKNNELSYNHFYKMLDADQAYLQIRTLLKEDHSNYTGSAHSIKRFISGSGSAYKPNVIMITVESLSADFMKYFGNTENITPVIDSLATTNLLFTNMYATGTRTVRGMEALSLAVPPTPGSSIVRRPDNGNLTTIGHIFEKAGYQRTFYYGGDGFFDNMNQYFGSNGYDVTDRGRNVMAGDNYLSKRTIIKDNQVHFENAWGIGDDDLFNAVIRGSDTQFKAGKPFYAFVMTTSNHRPFTYPTGKIDIPSGTNRSGAVKYTDYAIGQFIKNIRTKPWFKNTVVIIVADHCASSAGKNEIDISRYHIPCLVLNLPNAPGKIDKMCSQIDLYPTLFKLMDWSYESNLYGKDVLDAAYVPRIVLGTYQKLAYLKKDSLVVLSPQQKVETFIYNQQNNEQIPANFPGGIVSEAVANYQTAYELFKNGGLHQ
jgi:phosphoglycerol transferase MdoB-like AlkP superfamily enzyme